MNDHDRGRDHAGETELLSAVLDWAYPKNGHDDGRRGHGDGCWNYPILVNDGGDHGRGREGGGACGEKVCPRVDGHDRDGWGQDCCGNGHHGRDGRFHEYADGLIYHDLERPESV